MFEFFDFVLRFFRGWKRKAGCATLAAAGLCLANLLCMIAHLNWIVTKKSIPIMIAEKSTLTFLFSFIPAYFLLSRTSDVTTCPSRPR